MAAEITVDYVFKASGHHTGAGQSQRQTTNPPAQAVAALLADIEGSLKNEHGETCQVVWWAVQVNAKEPAEESRL